MKKVLCSALVAIMLLCMTACGSSVAGRYDFESMEMDGVKITAQSLKDMGAEMEMYIELEEDGTGTMASDGEVIEMGWEDGEIWPAEDPTDRVAFTIDGDTLTMEQDGVEMVFKK
ncbi:MAG: hypothetical protein IJN10_08620 [Firmicutes bacterium]|nr:hypothetical protein [Bacillota bacterium]